MARLARLVLPGIAHHVTQRGVRRMNIFTEKGDQDCYLKFLQENSDKAGTEILAYCLMPNHVHFVMVPGNQDGLRAALGETHRQYTRMVNFREGCRGHLWQERFHSFPMDERYLYACVRYVELNPVKAGLVKNADDWQWSSARGHLGSRDDPLIKADRILSNIADWRAYLNNGIREGELSDFHKHKKTGRPLGPHDWIVDIEKKTGRQLIKKKPGPKRGEPQAIK